MTDEQSIILSAFNKLSIEDAGIILNEIETMNCQLDATEAESLGFKVGDIVRIVSNIPSNCVGKVFRIEKVAKSHLWFRDSTNPLKIIWPKAKDCEKVTIEVENV